MKLTKITVFILLCLPVIACQKKNTHEENTISFAEFNNQLDAPLCALLSVRYQLDPSIVSDITSYYRDKYIENFDINDKSDSKQIINNVTNDVATIASKYNIEKDIAASIIIDYIKLSNSTD